MQASPTQTPETTMPLEIHSAEDVLVALEERRKEAGVSRRAVSERAGYAHAAYWWWQRKRGRVGLSAALCFAKALGFRIYLEPSDPPLKKEGAR